MTKTFLQLNAYPVFSSFRHDRGTGTQVWRFTLARLRAIVCTLILFGTTAPVAHAGDVVVFAAASLKTVLDDIAGAYEAETGNRVVLSYGGSSALARQIQQGAPADVFVSANALWMNVLEEEGRLRRNTRKVLAGNTLVIVGQRDRGLDLTTNDIQSYLGENGRLAMAFVDAVPAGIYGKEALTSLGLWLVLESRVVETENVRAALRLVSLGEVELGIVYATDVAASDGVFVQARFAPDAHTLIQYPAAITAESDAVGAADFFLYLTGEAAKATFAAHGFLDWGSK